MTRRIRWTLILGGLVVVAIAALAVSGLLARHRPGPTEESLDWFLSRADSISIQAFNDIGTDWRTVWRSSGAADIRSFGDALDFSEPSRDGMIASVGPYRFVITSSAGDQEIVGMRDAEVLAWRGDLYLTPRSAAALRAWALDRGVDLDALPPE